MMNYLEENNQKGRELKRKHNELTKQSTATSKPLKILETHLSGSIKRQSVREYSIKQPDFLKAKCLEALKIVIVYFPEFSDKLLTKELIEIFAEGVAERYPNLLADEITPAIKKKMQNYKFHTMPRLNDIFAMIDEYMNERLDVIEAHHNNKKVEETETLTTSLDFQKLRDALSEAVAELDEAEKEKREAGFEKAKREADNYHDNQNK